MSAGPCGLKNSAEAESAILQIGSFHYMAFLGILNVLMQREIGHIATLWNGLLFQKLMYLEQKSPRLLLRDSGVLLMG